ncbi:MAG: adenylate kinase [Planctomycetota bacterium]
MRRAGLRINVVGTSGAGKTTLAARLGERLAVPHAELAAFIARDAWVLCGNYTRIRPILMERANLIVWLDYPRWLVTWRVLCRSVERAWTKRELWAGNRESFRLTFFSRDSIIWWSIKRFSKNRRKYRAMFEELAGCSGV